MIEKIQRLPDGSGFAIMSFDLPKDHWLLINPKAEHVPPMSLRMGNGQSILIYDGTNDITLTKDELEQMLRAAGRYAVRATTACDTIKDFDPDAMVRNFINGVLGYNTNNGLVNDASANPLNQDPNRNVQVNCV